MDRASRCKFCEQEIVWMGTLGKPSRPFNLSGGSHHCAQWLITSSR